MYARTILVLGLMAAGCGGAQGERPEEVLPGGSLEQSGVVDCNAIDALSEVRPIDDFESGNVDYWFNDYLGRCTPEEKMTEGNTCIAQFPDPLVPQALAAEERCGSGYAFHLYGGIYPEWAIFQLTLPGAPVVAGAYDGVAFWAKKGSDWPDASSTLTVAFQDRFTDGAAASQADPSLQGTEVCDPSPPAGTETTGCGAAAFAVVGLPETWRLIKVPFSKFAQPSWGFQAPYLDTDALWTLKFSWFGPTSVDFWIDDVMFYAD